MLYFVKLGMFAYYCILYLCTVDGRSGRRMPSGELKDFPSDGCEQTTTTSGVEQEIHNEEEDGGNQHHQ